ncbi:hypothetical protein [uncultured Roseovarius sp.]|uniref:hypothetical protein n=1 Tax=uncultured Roseovarius sp. TaxID=293344 RepID=UPI002627C584|nr:hypothetical protein [uncultured Roseovarius sp.]
MANARRYITAGATLACAMGIGYFMQAGATAPVQSAAMVGQLPTLERPVEIRQIKLTSAEVVPPLTAPEPAVLPAEPVKLAVAKDEPLDEVLPQEEAAPSFVCDFEMQATPLAAAMVKVTLDAPCMINTRYTLHHNGMMFTAVTDEQGQSTLSVPALAEQAVFIASFDEGDGAIATANVDTLSLYDRYVVQWRGAAGLHVHALEYDAGFGEDGHVWAETGHDMARAASGEGGFLTRLGEQEMDQALMAEVYTFPTGTAPRAGTVDVRVEAEITTANCGRDLEAQSIAVTTDAAPKVQDIVLAMPDCEGLGDFLVLKNLFNDLKIARN